MLPYILLLLFSLLCIIRHDINRNRKGIKVSVCLLLLYAILLSGLSYRIGGDIYNYTRTYDSLPNLSEFQWNDISEYVYQPFYMYLCAIGKSISEKFYVSHLLQSALVCSTIFYFIWKRTRFPFTGILIFLSCYYFLL